MSIKQILLPAAAVVVLIFLGLGYSRTQVPRPCDGCPAPDLVLEFYDGYEWENNPTVNLSDMQGNIVVLNFWASWCGPCRVEAPAFEQAWRTFRDDNVIFLGLAYSDTDKNAREFLEEFDITYPNAPDLQLRAETLYQYTGIPETVFIDENGEIYLFHKGPLTEDRLIQTLEEMVASR